MVTCARKAALIGSERLGLKMILRITKWLLSFVAVLVGGLLVYAFAVSRPSDTTDPAIFMQDGRSVNYCDLPELDGSGKSADDIPKAYTPGVATQPYRCPFCRSAPNRSQRVSST